ncbi:MAG: hypothetical protein MUO97_07345 [Dehalococcoidia bacterium]|nr:hypothetical protein [Dehalococcoidia bacterium]
MSELWMIILTACITIGGGIIVYVVGRLGVALFVEPIHRLHSFIGEIADSLANYADVYSNPSGAINYREKAGEATEVFRCQATQLRARLYAIRWYRLALSLGLVRRKNKIEEASKELILLSKLVHKGPLMNYGRETDEIRRRIEELLGIPSIR